jgi:dTDP-glucose 4,6-dehydratase
MRILVTGGAGFIGSALIRYIIHNTDHKILNIDKITYAGNLLSLKEVDQSKNYNFQKIDICSREDMQKAFKIFKPEIIINLAAETHVDRSIDASFPFIETNIIGTHNLLEISREYFSELSLEKKRNFRFHHVSTDEVFGDLQKNDPAFNVTTAYNPSSPYSASKASSDHLVRAWKKTYQLPTIISNCSNNYGPYQYPEKLIPHIIINALNQKALPLYGDGSQIRDWLYVEDHAEALSTIALEGEVGKTYLVGGNNEIKNIDVVKKICAVLDELHPPQSSEINNYEELITFVDDRPGHDLRYAINTESIHTGLAWSPRESFETGIRKTIEWYLNNSNWWKGILKNGYRLSRQGGAKAQ